MDDFSKILTDKWKEVIESINIDGYSRKVDSVDLFRMNKYYDKPEIEFCYKVSFNFPMMGDGIDKKSKSDGEWHNELELRFTKMFWNPSDEVMPRLGSNSGETKFENSKVDYMTNQGYRFIVQFYPQGFISELRNEKLDLIGI